MQTVIKELIDELNELSNHYYKLSEYDTSHGIGIAVELIMTKLEKEKEQIINAYEDGKQNGMDSIVNVYMYIIGEKYYNETYNE
jgi:hypothetical protein